MLVYIRSKYRFKLSPDTTTRLSNPQGQPSTSTKKVYNTNHTKRLVNLWQFFRRKPRNIVKIFKRLIMVDIVWDRQSRTKSPFPNFNAPAYATINDLKTYTLHSSVIFTNFKHIKLLRQNTPQLMSIFNPVKITRLCKLRNNPQQLTYSSRLILMRCTLLKFFRR